MHLAIVCRMCWWQAGWLSLDGGWHRDRQEMALLSLLLQTGCRRVNCWHRMPGALRGAGVGPGRLRGDAEREGGSEQVIVLYTQIYTAKVQNAFSHINCLACTVQQMNQFLFLTARTGCEAFHFALLVSNMCVCFRNCQLISSKSPTGISRDQKL